MIKQLALIFFMCGAWPSLFSASGRDLLKAGDADPVDSTRLDSTQGKSVLLGYTSHPQKWVTGSVFSVPGQDVNKVPGLVPVYGLQGRVPGLLITSASAMGLGASASLRGAGSPLYVMDGVPLNPMGLKEDADLLQMLSASDIVSVEVLKDVSATAVYGVLGENGVVLITTRKGQSRPPALVFDSYLGLQEGRSILNSRLSATFLQNYGLGLNGGYSKLQYHVSGSVFHSPQVNASPISAASLTRYSLRANLRAQPARGLTVGTNWGFSRLSQQLDETARWDNQAGAQWLGQVFGQYEFLPGFSLRLHYGLHLFDQHSSGWQQLTWSGQSTRRSNTSHLPNAYHQIESMLSFRHRFNARHSLNLIAGFSQQNLKMERVENVQTGTDISRFESTQRSKATSFFSQVHYAFRDRYLLTLTARHDAFGAGGYARNYLIPAVGLGWRVSEEAFMENVTAISELKLRAGFGNNRISGTDQWNIGLDLGMGHDRILFTVDYYHGNRSFIAPFYIPNTTGFITQIRESSMTNQGVEFCLRSRNTTGAFQWDTQLVMGHNLVTLQISEGMATGTISGSSGYPIGTMYGSVSFPVYLSRPNDLTPIGSANPKWFGGLSNTFRYGRFSAELLTQISLGGQIWVRQFNNGQYVAPQLKSRSFFQMRNVFVGYDFHSTRWNWMNKAQLFVSLQNLFTVSELPKEQSIDAGNPRERVCLAGIRMGI